MTNNKVTIVIPTFNRANFVAKTIDSALAQTTRCDIIVCDHGSKDNTPEVMKAYEGKVKYIRREDDFGPHFCWLEGILHAKTEFVHLHFDDDLMDDTFVERSLALMSDDVGMLFCQAKILDYGKNEITIEKIFSAISDLTTGVYKSSILEKKLYSGLMLSPACCLYRKKDLLDGLYQGDLPLDFGGNYHGVGPDHFFSYLAVMRYPKFAFIDESLVTFGSHDGSITTDANNDEEKAKRIRDSYEALRNYCRLLKLYQSDKKTRKKTMKKDLNFNKKIERTFKLFFKAIGLRKKEVK